MLTDKNVLIAEKRRRIHGPPFWVGAVVSGAAWVALGHVLPSRRLRAGNRHVVGWPQPLSRLRQVG
jgi:hypothetical protein